MYLLFLLINLMHPCWKKVFFQIGLDQNIRLFEYSFVVFVVSIFNFEIRISNILFILFFLNTWHPPRNSSQLVRLAEHLQQTIRQWKTLVLTYSMHIFHERFSISYKRACRTSTFEIMNLSTQKTRHVNGPVVPKSAPLPDYASPRWNRYLIA